MANEKLITLANLTSFKAKLDETYLGISAKAADSSKLNGQAASYYLNYNNLSNKPTIPTIPTSLKNPNKLKILANNDTTALIEYDGSAEKSLKIAASSTNGAFTISDGTTTKTIQLAGDFTNTHNSHGVTVISGKKSDGSTDITASSSSTTSGLHSVTLGDSGITAGTYKRVTVNAKGIVVAGDNTDSDTHNSHKVISGLKSDGTTNITSASASSGDITLGDSGVTAGTYKRVTVNAKGIVIGGDNTDANDNTWRKVQLNGTDKLGTGTGTNPLNIKAGSNMTITESNGTFTFSSSYTDTNTWRPIGTGATDAAAGNHTHTLSLATDSGTSAVDLAANTKYKLTAGGNTLIFKTPADNNTVYTHPSYTATTAGLYKIGRDSTGHVVIGDAFTIPTTLDSISDGTTRKLSNYLPLSGGTITVTESSVTKTTVLNAGSISLTTQNGANSVRYQPGVAGQAPSVYIKNNGGTEYGVQYPSSSGTFALTSQIPTVNNSTITIKQAGRNNQTFTLNGSATTINLDNTTYSNATTSAAGLMSSTDKTRLDSMWNVWSSDGTDDTLINKVEEVLAAFDSFAEGNTIVGLLANKVDTNDSRLTNARTPTSHTHGNVANDGTITSTAVTSATGVLVYDSNNKIQRATAANARAIIGAGTSSFSGSYNDLTNKPTIPTSDSGLTNNRYVRYDVSTQSLTDTQKANARTNIGAGTSSFSGSYNDLTNKPTIPTVNNATLTIQKNGTTVKTFTANASSDVTANITVPTKVSELTNDSNFTSLSIGSTSSTAAAGNHTHTLSLATDSGTSTVNLSANTTYKLTAGGNTLIFKTPSDSNTNTASAVDNILDGSNSGTAITYAPYTSQQSKLSFDTSTTAPSRTDRLNLNGYLYATKLYSGGTEVSVSGHTHSQYLTSAPVSSVNGATGAVSIGNTTGIKYLTSAPSSANTDGGLKVVVLSSEPTTKYSGYIYFITE